MKTSLALAASSIVAALTLQGCGGDEKESTTTTTAAQTTSMRGTTVTTTTTTTLPRRTGCLCAFDIDRTWTAGQKTKNVETVCPGTKVQKGIMDTAYGGGDMVLSDLALNLERTFCKDCFMSVVTAGVVSDAGSPERTKVLELLHENRTMSSEWTPATKVASSLVISAADGSKQDVLKDVVAWFASDKNVHIDDKDVHFFDDRIMNIEPFKKTQYNARQISCASRDMSSNPGGNGAIGLCGGKVDELVKDAGVVTCGQDAVATELTI